MLSNGKVLPNQFGLATVSGFQDHSDFPGLRTDQNQLVNIYLINFYQYEIMFQSYSLYPGLPVIHIPAKFFKSWAVWQNEKDSVSAESDTSPQGASSKSCSNNINGDKSPPVQQHTVSAPIQCHS